MSDAPTREQLLERALRDAIDLVARILDDCEEVEPQYAIPGIEKYTAEMTALRKVLDASPSAARR